MPATTAAGAAALAALVLAVGPQSPDAVASAAAAPREAESVPGVPFVPQERLLCGAASVEMALRHAGVRGVYARDFQGLVREEEGGIRVDDLTGAVRALGWEVRAGPSDPAALRADLGAGRPVTVLLAESRDRYHYVLVVGWSRDEVTVHDPARGPGIGLGTAAFIERWESAGRWALTLLSGPSPAEDGAGVEAVPSATGDPDAPPHPLLVEAGRLFRASRWEEAAASAGEAARADPGDPRVWALLATSRYLAGDPGGALQAWNRGGAPLVDGVTVAGLRRTRHPVVHGLVGLRPGERLDAADFQRARRRLSLLPSAEATSLSYRALPGGLVEVEATALEPPLLPRGPAGLAGILLPAVASTELHVRVPSLTGGGEAVSLRLRASGSRPAVGVELAAPGAPRLPGVLSLRAAWERERHRSSPGGPVDIEERHGATLALTDWANGWLRWELGGGLDRWRGAGRTAVVAGTTELRPAGARAAVTLSAEAGAGSRDAPSYGRWSLSGSAALPVPAARWHLRLRALAAGAGRGAPRTLWPGAGVGRAREGLLRAHPLEREGALSGETLGRALLNATLELERDLLELPFGGLGAAAFVDAARVGRRAEGASRGTIHLLDGGAGVRLNLPTGRVRADAAWGAGGRRAVSLAWDARDPARR